jgi:hypothetical protein
VRQLYRVDDDQPWAYAQQRRDFHLVRDDSLWAHESHHLLLSAASGVPLVRRVGNVYYDVETGLALYYEASEPRGPAAIDAANAVGAAQSRR